jgi:SAM-dependent methyltransferase
MEEIKTEAPESCKSQSPAVLKAAGQYQSKRKARRFVASVPGTRTDRREKNCIRKALAFLNLPSGSSILDIPCGGGRLFPLLKQNDNRVMGADISASMVEEATQAKYDNLKVADVFETGFPDKEFDLVVCHRLFQYFSEASDRRGALAELSRISKGPVLVSFSCNLAFDYWVYKVKRFFGLTRARHCRPISFIDFGRDARAAGMEVVYWIAARPLISRRWYAVLKPRTAGKETAVQKLAPFSDIARSLAVRAGFFAAAVLLLMFLLSAILPKPQDPQSQFREVVRLYVHDDDRLYFVAGSELDKIADEVGDPLSKEQMNIEEIVQKNKQINKDSFFLLPRHLAEKFRKNTTDDLQFIQYFVLKKDRYGLFTTETEHIGIN